MRALVRPGSRAALWASTVLAVGWAVMWGCVAWGVWQNGAADRDLVAHGVRTTAVVADAAPGAPTKYGYCRQSLTVSAGRGPLTVTADRPCTEPWMPGDRIDVLVEPAGPGRAVAAPDRAVAADSLPDPVATSALPVLVVGLAAIIAGYPFGRLLIAVEGRRADKLDLDLSRF